MTKNARIYLKTKDVIDVAGSEALDPQHSYIVAEFNSNSYILRAGPGGVDFSNFKNGDISFGKLKFVGAENLVQYIESNSSSIHHDWDYDGSHSSRIIFEGSDSEVEAKFSSLRNYAHEINQQRFEYRWYGQNCNTAVAHILSRANFDIDLSNLRDSKQNNLLIPGAESTLLYRDPNTSKYYFDSLIEYIKKFNNASSTQILIDEKLSIEKDAYVRILADSGELKFDGNYVDKSDNPLDYDQVFYTFHNQNGEGFTIIRNEAKSIRADNSKISIDDLIANAKESIKHTQQFIESSISDLISTYQSPQEIKSLILAINDGLAKKMSIYEIAEAISVKNKIKSLMLDVQNYLMFSKQDYEKILSNNFNEISPQAKVNLDIIKNSNAYKILYSSIVSFVSELAIANKNLNAQQYSQIAVNSIAQSTAQIALENAFNYFKPNYAIIGSSAMFESLSYGVGHMVSVAVNDLFADDKMNSHQWQSSLVSAGVVATSAGVGSAIASAMFTGSFAGPIGSAIAVVLAYSMLGGKKLEYGEYFEKIDFYTTSLQENGVDLNFFALKNDGVIINSSKYYNSNIYGGFGDDALNGGNGTNQMFGYDGDDQIFGKNDNDIIYGNNGSDTIIAGHGDDYAVGGNGDDILFGGGGDDAIFGNIIPNDPILIENYDLNQSDNDLIRGGDGDDLIYGQHGDDVILGDRGNDIIFGDEDDDIIFGGSGKNKIKAGEGNDIIYASNFGDNLYGDDGDDEIYGGVGDDVIYGNSGNDIIDGDLGRNLIFGGEGDDIIYSGSLNQPYLNAKFQNSIHGEFGNDILIGSDAIDIISDGDGNDVIFANGSDDIVNIGRGNNIIFFEVGDGNDIIKPHAYNQHYNYNEYGENIIKLMSQNPLVDTSSINSVVIKKLNNDLKINFLDQKNQILPDSITIEQQFQPENNSNILIDKIEIQNAYSIDFKSLQFDENGVAKFASSNLMSHESALKQQLLESLIDQILITRDLEKIDFFKSSNPTKSFDEIFKFSAGEIDNLQSELLNEIKWEEVRKKRNIFGGHYTVWRQKIDIEIEANGENSGLVGNNWSENLYGNIYSNQIYGGSGYDKIDGHAGNDVIFGGEDDDNLSGGLDNDLIVAGGGNDNIQGNEGDDEIYGNSGDDFIKDFNGKNLIFAGFGNDQIRIANYGNQIFGESGNDNIQVDDSILSNSISSHDKAGNLIYGNSGNDSIKSGMKDDFIFGQSGLDYIEGGLGDDYISGGEEADYLIGGGGDDKIFGDIGNDNIFGNEGNDLIWGGMGVDNIDGGLGNDLIKAGAGDDIVYGNEGDDSIFGESGSDIIYLNSGKNYVSGGFDGDIIYGGAQDDKIMGDEGDDLIFDGAGNDYILGGDGGDTIIIESIKNQFSSHDVIADFEKNIDKIIIKTDFRSSLNFVDLINNSKQINNDIEINIGNQKLTIINTQISDLNMQNFGVGYALDDKSKILFAENYSQILFGNDLDNTIFGSNYDDEIFGGAGQDSLFGLGGNDIFYFEADDKFLKTEQLWYSDEIAYYTTRLTMLSRSVFPIYFSEYYEYKPKSYSLENNKMQSVYASKYDFINLYSNPKYEIAKSSSRVQYEPFRSSQYLDLSRVEKIDFLMQKNTSFKTTNFHNNANFEINGYNRNYDIFDGGEGFNTIVMTNGNDFISPDDNFPSANQISRLKSIEAIYANGGDDIINLSSKAFNFDDILIHGGKGNDKLWLNSGDDNIFGNEGSDEIFAGSGDDFINGGEGDDVIYGGLGNDIINANLGADKIYAQEGDDYIYAGERTAEIFGGSGLDTINFAEFESGVLVDLPNNIITNLQINSSIKISDLENVIATNFDDNIIGNNISNIIKPLEGNDIIKGGAGGDIYIFDNNFGKDIIEEEGLDIDLVELNNVSLGNLILEVKHNDLIVSSNIDKNNSIIFKNQFSDFPKIEFLKLKDQEKIDISKILLITNEDSEIILDSDFFQRNFPANFSTKNTLRNYVIKSANGNLIFNELANNFIYTIRENFYGIDELTINNGIIEEKIFAYFNPVNDAPRGLIPDFNFKVNESILINLNEYFYDDDGDKMKFDLSVEGFKNLPSWIDFNSETGQINTKIHRNGSLDFKVKIIDNFLNSVYKDFKINISRDLKIDADFIQKTALKADLIEGDATQNKLYSQAKYSDLIIANDGDDEIFYLEDEIWQNTAEINFKAWNIYSGDEIDVTNKIRSFDCFDGGNGYDILNLTSASDALFLDDQGLSNFGAISKFSDIEEIRAGAGDDVIDMTSLFYLYGDIKILGGEGDDILWSNNGNDKIFGEAGNDIIHGGVGDDYLGGGEGDDLLQGYDGDDIIYGDAGSDELFGGDGQDIFVYKALNESNNLKFDNIKDFDVFNDKISLEGLNFNSIQKLISSENIIENLDNQFTSNNLFYNVQNGSTSIFNSNADFVINLQGNHDLTNENFMF